MATWLDQVNNIRSMAAVSPIPSPGVTLPPVTEDPALSDACRQPAVRENDPLMVIDPTNYAISVRLAEAAVQQAQANMQNTSLEAKRREALPDLAVSEEQ